MGLAIAAAVVALLVLNPPSAPFVPWSRLGTEDVHSLSFGASRDDLLFGHHGGVLESRDGGQTWLALGATEDAMSLATAPDGSIVIAGHDVFSASSDGGTAWTPITTDLPDLDIHGFARDPADQDHMWAALASGGLYESRSFGATFERVSADTVLMPVAFRGPDGTRLVMITSEGIVASDDGGRTSVPLASPELFPITALAVTPDGRTLVAGGTDGLARSSDGGGTWTALPFEPGAAAVAISAQGDTIAVVARDGSFYRSDDGGTSWHGP